MPLKSNRRPISKHLAFSDKREPISIKIEQSPQDSSKFSPSDVLVQNRTPILEEYTDKESEKDFHLQSLKLRQMKKFYRNQIPNHKQDSGWTSPIIPQSEVMAQHQKLMARVPEVQTLEQRVWLKSQGFVSKVKFVHDAYYKSFERVAEESIRPKTGCKSPEAYREMLVDKS